MARISTISLLASIWALGVRADVNPTADPWPFNFSITAGPDGPWNVLWQQIDFPEMQSWMYPAMFNFSAIVNQTACQDQNSNCELPLAPLWGGSGAQSLSKWQNSDPFDAKGWCGTFAEPLRLRGSGRMISERIVLDKEGARGFLDYSSLTVMDSFESTYPNGASYTVTIGSLSLYAEEETFTYTSGNGTELLKNHTMVVAYNNGYVPSISFGIHLGSASQNINGSMYWGGYDGSRVIDDPISSNSLYFTLQDISLGVWEGGSNFKNVSGGAVDGLMSSKPVSVIPNPGVPYLYLPRNVCDRIASHLPVTYSNDFGLYLWNTDDDAYSKIVTSPSYMNFTLKGDSGTTTISVPFALLNLNLTQPLAREPTPYFPCSPYEPSDGNTFQLGRAFLQGAFYGGNWQSNKMFLAQAPGPDYPSINVRRIRSQDDTLRAMTNAPEVYSTWQNVLKPVSGAPVTSNSTSGGSGNNGNNNGDGGNNNDSGLSTGAKAGIAIGVALGVIALLIAALLILRRKKKQRKSIAQWGEHGQPQHYDVPPSELHNRVAGEMNASEKPGATYGGYQEQYRDSVPPAYGSGTHGKTQLPTEESQLHEMDGLPATQEMPSDVRAK